MSDISKMDYKQLRNEVQLLRDELAIMQRKYEDILYNLDDDNFSSTLLREKDGMKTSIEVNAEGIKTKVSNEEFESAKTQLANEITSKVNTLDGKLSSQISQTASEINATVSANYTDLSGSISSVRQTANGVSSRVDNIEDGEFNGYTLFEQTASKFSFTGNVEISGNAIAGGTITGAAFQDSGGTAKLCLGADSGSSVGDLNLIRISGSGAETNIFSVFDDLTMIDLKAFGNIFLSSSTSGTTYPSGTWDFTNCDVKALAGGGSGGTATAVFG